MNVLLTIDGKDIIMPISKDAVDLTNIYDSISGLLDLNRESISMTDIISVLDEEYHNHPCLKQLPDKKEFSIEEIQSFLFEDDFCISHSIDAYVEQAYQEKFNVTVIGGYMFPEYHNITEKDKHNDIFIKCSIDTEISDYQLIDGKEIDWKNDLSKSYWRKYQKQLEIEKKDGPKLYWVETYDHDEDWFIIAQSSYHAKKFHNEFEGYGLEGFNLNCECLMIRAIPICNVPSEIFVKLSAEEDKNIFSNKYVFHAQTDFLEELGAKIISEKEPRIVEFDGMQFKEGDLQFKINHINNMHINKNNN